MISKVRNVDITNELLYHNILHEYLLKIIKYYESMSYIHQYYKYQKYNYKTYEFRNKQIYKYCVKKHRTEHYDIKK